MIKEKSAYFEVSHSSNDSEYSCYDSKLEKEIDSSLMGDINFLIRKEIKLIVALNNDKLKITICTMKIATE